MNNIRDKQCLPRIRLLLAAIALALPLAASAQVFTWNGSAGDSLWSTPGNWTISGANADTGTIPVGKVGALLGNAASDRIVIYTGASELINGVTQSNWLRTLTFTQSSAALNQLSVLNNLNVGNSFALESADGGTTRLFLSNYNLGGSGTTTAVTMNLGYSGETVQTLRIGANGVLEFGGKVETTNNGAVTFRYGTVHLDGGVFNLQNAVKSGTNGSVGYSLGGALTISSGSLVFGTASSHAEAGNGYLSDIRFSVNGDFTMTGGSLRNTGSATRQLWLQGATNTISGDSAIDAGINFVLYKTGSQSLSSTAVLNNVTLRVGGDSVVTLGVSAPGQNIGKLEFLQASADKTLTYKLDSDLTLRDGYALPSAVGSLAGESTYGIDTNGHTLNLTSNTGRWTPNRTNSSYTARWSLTGGGEIAATAFDFSGTGVAVSVGADTTLRATGGAASSGSSATVSILSSSAGGSIAAASRFVYDGGVGNEGQLQSNRAIGILEVESGALRITGTTDFAAAGGIVVRAGATLDFGSRLVTASSYSIGIDGNAFGSITSSGPISLDGISLEIDLQNFAGPGQYDLFGAATSGNLSGVSIVGSYTASLVQSGNIWSVTTDDNLIAFSFDQSSGLLSVAAVPEPAAIALLAGSGLLLLALALHRRSKY